MFIKCQVMGDRDIKQKLSCMVGMWLNPVNPWTSEHLWCHFGGYQVPLGITMVFPKNCLPLPVPQDLNEQHANSSVVGQNSSFLKDVNVQFVLLFNNLSKRYLYKCLTLQSNLFPFVKRDKYIYFSIMSLLNTLVLSYSTLTQYLTVLSDSSVLSPCYPILVLN